MKLSPFDNLVVFSVLLAAAVNFSSEYLQEYFPGIAKIAFYVIISLLGAWIVVKVFRLLYNSIRQGQYALLIFLLDDQNRLLLRRHPFHKVLLPPGGRLSPTDAPHLAVYRALKTTAGVTAYEFHPKFHARVLSISERVEQVPAPIAVQVEHRLQRSLVAFHCAFVYVCRPLPYDLKIETDEGYPRFLSLEEIMSLKIEDRPFDDIIYRYREILKVLDNGKA